MCKGKPLRFKEKLSPAVNRKTRKVLWGLAFLFAFWVLSLNVFADDVQNVNYVERGFFRIFTAAFQLPRYLVEKTLNEPPPFGTLDGALTGTYYTVSAVVGGAFDIVRGTLPYAKYLIFFV